MSIQEDLRKAEQRPDDVIAAVLRDHAEIKQLFADVKAAEATDQKEDAFHRLVRKLVVHETAEQEVVHPLARTAADVGDVVEERLAEESEGESTLSELEKMGVEHAEFDAKLEELRREVEEHAEAEVETEHPRIDGSVSADRLKQLSPVYRAAEAAAPTHPHPHGPTSATGNLAVGPFVAMIDQARDAIREAKKKLG